jgi:hypothetical protein
MSARTRRIVNRGMLGIAVAAGGVVALMLVGAPGCDDSSSGGKPGTGGTTPAGLGGGGVSGTGGSEGGAAGGDSAATGGVTGQTIDVPATLAADTTWTTGNTYVLPADTKVAVKSPAILTIQPGTVILGSTNSALVITRGAKIIANGTAQAPIVFTSSKSVGLRAPGDWGGLIILGKAPVNVNANSTPPGTEAPFEAFGANEPDGLFGGSDPDDSSGSLKYVRFEFGGVAYLPDREWNNVTFCGVGRGTVVDYIQSHKGADDSVEFFGGTVNVKHLVLTQNEDDGFDTDNGWEGKAQFVAIQHVAPRGTDASNGYESDNHGTATSFTAVPRTLPTVYNVTMIGKKDYVAAGSWGALFRRGTGGMYFNHIITRWARGAVEVRDQQTMDQITAGNLFVKNSIFFDNMGADGNWPAPNVGSAAAPILDFDEKTIFTAAAWSNRDAVDPMLTDPTNLTAPNFKPASGSPALTGGASPPDDGFFDVTATFVGAVGTTDWTIGWTSFPQN